MVQDFQKYLNDLRKRFELFLDLVLDINCMFFRCDVPCLLLA
jgi:hypothetical protein